MQTLFFLLVAAAIGWLIMSERIKDGVVVKAGLILIALGFIAAAGQIFQGEGDLIRPLYAIGVGCLVCIAGVFIRGLISGDKCRRLSDWVEQHSRMHG